MIHEPVVYKSKLSDRAASAVTFVLQVITPSLPLVAALLFWKK
jgi:hypothetical protein